jgi:hypothetical protein
MDAGDTTAGVITIYGPGEAMRHVTAESLAGAAAIAADKIPGLLARLCRGGVLDKIGPSTYVLSVPLWMAIPAPIDTTPRYIDWSDTH